MPKFEIEVRAEGQHCFDRRDKTAHVVTGSLRAEQRENPSVDEAMAFHAQLDLASSKLDVDLKALRLCLCAHIEALGAYWYEIDERGEPELVSSTVPQHFISEDRGLLAPRQIHPTNNFLVERRRPVRREYLQLAWDHWDQSMTTSMHHLKFLSLVMALETLFNPGGSEIKYRVARSMAVLLGRDKQRAEDIYEATKLAYDARSQLVHTGRTDKAKKIWLWSVTHQVNRAINKLMLLDLPKETVAEILTRMAFGDADRVTYDKVHMLPEGRDWLKEPRR